MGGHRHEAAEIRRGTGVYAENNRFIFCARNSSGERFSVEFLRQGEKFNSIDIQKLTSEPGKEPKYAEESVSLIVNPDGKFERAVIATEEERRLIPAGGVEVLLAGYLQDLEFDAESNNAERRRLATIEKRGQLIALEKNLKDRNMLEISWEGKELTPAVMITLPDGRVVKNWGEGMSHLALLGQLIDEDSEVAKAAGVTVTEV